MGPMERMRDELARARGRSSRVLLPEEAGSPMDRNPTVEVSADLIADCLLDVDAHSGPADDLLFDAGLREAAAGRPVRRRDLA